MDLNRFFRTTMKWIKNHEADIEFGVGVITGVAAIYTSNRATYKKLPTIVEKKKEALDVIEQAHEMKEIAQETPEGTTEIVPYTDSDYKKDKRIAKFDFAKDCAKAYWLPATLTVVSGGCLGRSFFVQKREIGNLKATASMLSSALAAKIPQNPEVVQVVNEDGEIVEKDIQQPDNICRFLFDPVNSCRYSKDVYANNVLIQEAERQLNYKLRIDRSICLNDVLKQLGMRVEKAGYYFGQTFDETNENIDTQFKIRYVLPGYNNERDRYITPSEYLDLGEPSVWLEFSCREVLNEVPLKMRERK